MKKPPNFIREVLSEIILIIKNYQTAIGRLVLRGFGGIDIEAFLTIALPFSIIFT
jgi:hypothetical protein